MSAISTLLFLYAAKLVSVASQQLPGKWELNATGGGINIVSEWAQNKCLDLPGGKTDNGALLWLWSCNGLTNQQWIFAADTWKIQYAGNPNKCIDALGWKGVKGAGTRLGLWDCNGLDSQKWGYDSSLKTIYLASSQSNANLCMDLPGEDDGAPIDVWTCNQHSNQAWDIRGAGPSPSPSGYKAGIALHLEKSTQADRSAIAGSTISWYYNWAQ